MSGAGPEPWRVVVDPEPRERGAGFALRRRVFVDEQSVPLELEQDGLDDEARHAVVFDAAEAEAGHPSPTPRSVLDRASRHLRRGGFASIATVPELSRLEVPADFLESRYRKLGIAVRQDASREGADIVVVMLVGG